MHGFWSKSEQNYESAFARCTFKVRALQLNATCPLDFETLKFTMLVVVLPLKSTSYSWGWQGEIWQSQTRRRGIKHQDT
jgi:hypothetical protein